MTTTTNISTKINKVNSNFLQDKLRNKLTVASSSNEDEEIKNAGNFSPPKKFGHWRLKNVNLNHLKIDKITSNVNCGRYTFDQCKLNCNFQLKSVIAFCTHNSIKNSSKCCCHYNGDKNHNVKCARLK